MSSSDRKKSFPVQSAAILALPVLLLFFPAGLAKARSDKGGLFGGKTVGEQGISIAESRRDLIILPIENDSGAKEFDYLKRGVAKILTARLQKYGYIIATRVRERFFFRTGEKVAASPNPPARSLPGRLPLEVRFVPYDKENYRLLKTGSPSRIAFEEKADYLVWGWLEKGTESGKLNLQLRLYDARLGRRHSLSFALDPREYTVELEEPAARMFALISREAPVQLEVETTEPGARAYLDDLYLGRTPLIYRVVPGRYRLQIRRRGFQVAGRSVEIRSGQRNLFRVPLVPQEHRSRLVIRSTPPGASVYLDTEYLGRTPLRRDSLEPGSHRLRAVLQGHIDRFIGVRLKNDEDTELELSLEPGNTREHYQDPGYVLLDWTRTDMFYGSLISTLGFYGSWGYFQIRADRAASSIRAVSLFLLVPGADPLVGLNGLSDLALLYQLQIFQENNRLVRRYKRGARISAGAGGLTFLLAGFFLYRELTEEREIGEIGMAAPVADEGGVPLYRITSQGSDAADRLRGGEQFTAAEEILTLGWTIRF